MLSNELIIKIKSIIENLPNDILNDLRGVGIEGSGCLPFINNYHDIDIYVYYPDAPYPVDGSKVSSEIKQKRKMTREIILKELTENLNIPNNIDVKICPERKLLGVIDYNEWSAWNDIYLNLYQHIYAILVYKQPDFNSYPEKVIEFFNAMDKKIYLNQLKNWIDNACFQIHFNDEINPHHRTKRLYHILTSLYILENNSFTDFTEEQIKNINIAHDMADGYEELWDWAKNKIDSLLVEYEK